MSEKADGASAAKGGRRRNTHLVNPKKLKQLMDIRLWAIQDLAIASGVSPSTIARVFAGVAISGSNIKLLANACGIGHEQLLEFGTDYASLPHPLGAIKIEANPEDFLNVKLTVAVPFNVFNEPDYIVMFQTSLKKYIHATGAMPIAKLENGSTVVTIPMSKQDVLRLLAEMLGADLRQLKITKVSLEKHVWLYRMLAALKITGTPKEPDEATWAEMQNFHMLDDLLAD